VLIRPAGRIADQVKGQIVDERRFHLVLMNRYDEEDYTSKATYNWKEVVTLAKYFAHQPREKSLALRDSRNH
jgi:hypothetical protein